MYIKALVSLPFRQNQQTGTSSFLIQPSPHYSSLPLGLPYLIHTALQLTGDTSLFHNQQWPPRPVLGRPSLWPSSAWVREPSDLVLLECIDSNSFAGCRWAGGVRDASGLWELLRNNREGWREFGPPHFSVNALLHYNPDRPGSLTTRGAFLLEEDARLFDHSFFGITGREVETMDPSQRKVLEVVYEAFENAGETFESIAGSRTGVFVGNFAFDHLLTQSRDWESPRPYAATGVDTCILANRVSYIFNLHGPR